MNIRDWFKQTAEDIDGRLRNPLILSFILVWLYKHWELVYMIFTFEEKITFPYRIMFIKIYLLEQGFCSLIICPILLSMLSLALFYILGVIGSTIKIYFGKRLNAFALHKADAGNFETKAEFNKFKEENKGLKREIYKLDEEMSEFKTKNKDLDHKLTQAVDEYIEMKENWEAMKESETEKSVQVTKLIAERDVLKERVESETGLAALNVQRGNELKKYEDELNLLEKNSTYIKTDSDNLANIFGENTIWDVFINEVKIESIKFDGRANVMVTSQGSIRITNIRIAEKKGLISFDKNTPKFSDLTNTLVKYDDDTLYGTEGGHKIKYTRTGRKMLK